MVTAKLLEHISVEDYLAAEQDASVRHEYVYGRLYAMAGASDAHNRIVMNLSGQLYNAASTAGCVNYASDMKGKADEQSFYYPDFMSVCEDDKGDYVKKRPCLIIEVFSRSTKATDQREKREAYLAMSSLQTYLLTDSESKDVTSYERSAAGWLERTQTTGEIAFACLDTALTLEDIYRGVRFEPSTSSD